MKIMKNLQKGFVGFPILIAILLGIVVVSGGAYLIVHNNKTEQKLDSGSQNVPVTTDNNQNTVVNPSNNQSVFVGAKKTFLPERIVSIDTSKKTFVVNYESRQAPFTIPTEFSVVSETTIKKENSLLNFNNLSVNDVVWIRAYEKGTNKYVAKNVIITNDWRSSQVIIKKIETNKITAEVFLPPQRRGEQTILTIIPETEIRKGKAEEGENRKVVGLNNLAVGDIASVVEVGFGVHSADDKGPFYTTEIDVVSPYYCEQYLKPTGCIEKNPPQNQSQSTNSDTPYIGSITPWSAPVGTTIEIRGSGLVGFEGDVYFFFKRSDGKIARLSGVVSTQTTGDAVGAQTARVVLKEPCQQGQTVYGDYSGIPAQCDYVQLTTGVYKVYTTPWGKNSNEVQFTITN